MNLQDVYKGRRVLVTGHTGFKGSWLCYLLHMMGADVMGISRPPHTATNHYQILNLHDVMAADVYGDLASNHTRLDSLNPEIVFHLAANAIVARTFNEPKETFQSNVMGAVNILEACRKTKSVKAVVAITTDKIYANKEWDWGYRENDEMGDTTPYGASKVCVEHVINCYRAHFIPMMATARAGNVIGGGDWAYKRLIPDIVRATIEGNETEVHTPNATRPWQHVLEPLSGYLMLGAKLLEGDKSFAKAFNFGPDGEMTVLDVMRTAQEIWPKVKFVVKKEETHPSMVELLRIDSTEARKVLGWKPRWNMEHAIRMAVMWYKIYYETGEVMTKRDINDYMGGNWEC